MKHTINIVAFLSSFAAALSFCCSDLASARGAAPNIMNSPGYQRALEESRKRYRQEVQPSTRPQPVHPRKTKRPRGHRH